LIIAAAVGAILQPSWWRSSNDLPVDRVIAGTVVDETTNGAVGQATLSLSGRTETYVTEDDGNFRIELRNFPEHGRTRIHVAKNGYRPYDVVISPPVESLIIPLKRM